MTIRHTVAACLLATLATGAKAGNESGEQGVEQRVSRLEKVLDKLPSISGFVNMRYQLEQNSYESSNSFDIRRARLDLRGAAAKTVSYRLQVEFAGTAKILDAYVNYAPLKELKIQAGEFKIPFSLENEYAPTTLETIENSMAISKLCNYSDLSGVNANGRDIGVMLHGGAIHRDGYDIINYAAGAFNGHGINLKDENDEKDYSARLTLRPTQHLSLSGSYYFGTYGGDKKSDGTVTAKQHRYRAAGGVKFTNRRWMVRSEYIYGRTGGMVSDGVYAVAGYYIMPERLQALVKYDYFAQNRDVVSTRENNYIVGLNYYVSRNFYVQANYTFKSRRGTKHDTNLLSLQFFARF